MQISPGPELGVLRHLRPVDDLAEGVVVVDHESHRGAQPHLPVVRPGHHVLRLELQAGGDDSVCPKKILIFHKIHISAHNIALCYMIGSKYFCINTKVEQLVTAVLDPNIFNLECFF